MVTMTVPKSSHIVWHPGQVTRREREALRGHKGATLWFTGLSGSGKSTLTRQLEWRLCEQGLVAYALDGDNIRHGLSSDLGFSADERTENIRRTGEVAKLFTDAGTLTLCAFISPYRVDRDRIRALMAPGDFIEIYVKAPLQLCEERDPKGLYKKARTGEIADFTGVSAPYEEPLAPELVLDTEHSDAEANVQAVVDYLHAQGYITGR